MQGKTMDLVATFDKNYVNPFKTMLKSIVINNSKENIHVWLLHSNISQNQLKELEAYCDSQSVILDSVRVERKIFENAPISKQYPQEMYYRLLAPHLLLSQLKKVLYLDQILL